MCFEEGPPPPSAVHRYMTVTARRPSYLLRDLGWIRAVEFWALLQDQDSVFQLRSWWSFLWGPPSPSRWPRACFSPMVGSIPRLLWSPPGNGISRPYHLHSPPSEERRWGPEGARTLCVPICLGPRCSFGLIYAPSPCHQQETHLLLWEIEVLMVGSRQQRLAALYGGGGWAGGGHVALKPVMARKAGRQGTLGTHGWESQRGPCFSGPF